MVYQKKDIEISDETLGKISDEIFINTDYRLKEDAILYEDDNRNTAFETLEEGMVVRVLMEPYGGLAYISFEGLRGYVDLDKLEEI